MKKIKDIIIWVLTGVIAGLLIAMKFIQNNTYNIVAKNKRKGTQVIKDLTINTKSRKLPRENIFKRLKEKRNEKQSN